jgi:hypothetical protein
MKQQLCVRTFVYSKQEQKDEVRKVLLDVWEITLHNCQIDVWNPSQASTAGHILRSLIQRSEFSLESIDPNLTKLSAIPHLPAAIMRRYFLLLVATFQWTCKKMKEFSKDMARDAMHLYADIIAVSFIRIPSVQEYIVKCIVTHRFLPVVDIASITVTTMPAGADAGEGGSGTAEAEYDAPSSPPPSRCRTAQVPSDIASDRKHYHVYPSVAAQTATASAKFIASHPSLFKWNLFEVEYIGDGEPTCIIPADEDWAKLILCNAEFFSVFFRYLNQHIMEMAGEKQKVLWDCISGYHDLVDLWCVALNLCCQQTMDLFMRMEGVFPSKKQKLLNEIKERTSEMTLERAARARRSVLDCTVTVIKGNPTLLNYAMLLLFRSTNVFYVRAVDNTLDLLQTWFATVSPETSDSTTYRLEYKAMTADDMDAGGSELINSKALLSSFKFQENDETGVERVPLDFDMDLYCEALRGCLEQEGFQHLMKILSFIYNNMQFLHGEMRMKLMHDLLMKEYFFRFFLHWSEEVRSFFHRILVFKAFRTSRKFLPIQTDTYLMSTNMFARSPEEEKIVELTARARAQQTSKKDKKGGGILNEMIIITNAAADKAVSPGGVVKSPKAMDGYTAPTQEEKEQRMSSYDRKFLDHEQTTLDLVLVSKLDAYIRLVIEQVGDPSVRNFDPKLASYAQRSLRSYTAVLRMYYDSVQYSKSRTAVIEGVHQKLSPNQGATPS